MQESRTTLSPSSMKSTIKKALIEMALMRGASPSAETLRLYTERLAKEPLEDVLATIQKIQDLGRNEGELAFPEAGLILKMVTIEGVSRSNRRKMAQDKRLVRWHCPECGVHQSGFISPGDDMPRVCRGIPRNSPGVDANGKPQSCMGIMNMVHNERAA